MLFEKTFFVFSEKKSIGPPFWIWRGIALVAPCLGPLPLVHSVQ